MRTNSGFLFALAGFALLSCGDAVIKSIGPDWPAPAIAFLRFLIAIPLLSVIIAAGQGKAGFIVRRPWVQFGRGAGIALSSMFFFLSIFMMPLAEATAIIFLNPVFTAIISIFVFREALRPTAWMMTAVALAGVALVLRPNISELGIVALLPVASAFCFAVTIVLNRIAAGTGDAIALQWAAALAATPVLAVVTLTGDMSAIPGLAVGWPPASVIMKCGIVAVSASLAHWLIYQGTLRTSASDAAQAVYAQLPVALAVDTFIFGNRPDLLAMSGASADHHRRNWNVAGTALVRRETMMRHLCLILMLLFSGTVAAADAREVRVCLHG